jgi:hypothetical protein
MADTQGIIQIIQKMVQENEPEEKIVQTLQSMGVTEDQAKRLVLIAQADTFTLLSSEISKIVQQKVEEQRNQMEKETQKFIDNELEQKKKEINEALEKEFLKSKLSLSDGQKQFQDSVNDTISKIAKLNEEVYSMSTENKKMIQTVEKDLTETKLKGVKVRRSVTRNILIGFSLILFLSAIALIVINFFIAFNIDLITSAILIALIGTAMIYLSTAI